MRRLLPAILPAVALLGAAGARAEPLSGAELVRELTDATLSGYNSTLWFSEYHAPDGRVLGHNANVVNVDACWKVRGDAVCYYYPRNRGNPRDGRLEFCWRLERMGDVFRITPAGRPGSGIARLEAGNPLNHNDGGRSWTCDELISRLGRPRILPTAAHGPATSGSDERR